MPTVQEVLQQGWDIHQAGDLVHAERVYREVLKHVPTNANAWVYLGIVLFDQRRFAESAEAYRAAIKLQPQFPVAWNNLGNTLRMSGAIDESESCFERALAQQPGYLSALKNRGTLWVWSGEIRRGLQWYEQGLKIDPGNAELHRNLGVINLLLGNYDKGWEEYRWRWNMPGMNRPAISAPVWRGEDLSGKSIALYPEQGLGDTIQFIRVAHTLQAAGARVIVICGQELLPLFSSAPGIEILVPVGASIPPVNFHGSLIDAVDMIHGQSKTLPYCDDLFSDGAGYLAVPETLVGYWKRWLDENVPGKRIGINWQGNPQHHADVYRSVPLSELQPLSELPGTSLISLQFGHGIEQLQDCQFADQIVRLPGNLDKTSGAFMDTAAILKNLDHVVTSDTSIAHLAGALGVPVTVMLGKVPDWRWLTESSTTAWYPSMNLVRQSELGVWSDVVENIRLSRSGDRSTQH